MFPTLYYPGVLSYTVCLSVSVRILCFLSHQQRPRYRRWGGPGYVTDQYLYRSGCGSCNLNVLWLAHMVTDQTKLVFRADLTAVRL